MGNQCGGLLEVVVSLGGLTLASTEEEIQKLAEDGRHHLKELRGNQSCGTLQINRLLFLVEKAEYLLEQKGRAKAGTFQFEESRRRLREGVK